MMIGTRWCTCLLIGLALASPRPAEAQIFERLGGAIPAGPYEAGVYDAITQPHDHTYGASWGDFDGDGDLDLLVSNHFDGNQLLRNDGVTFRPHVTFAAPQTAAGAVWSDLDNDGDLDLLIHALGEGNRLYLNQGEGAFLPVVSPLNDVADARDASVADVDRDGWADVLIVRRFNSSNVLYRNDGGGVLVGSSALPGDNSNAATWADYDADGDLDLFVVNSSSQQDRLYRNVEGSLIASEAIPVASESSSSSSWGDYDGDGDLDLFVASAFGADKLYRNDTSSDGEGFTPVHIPRMTDWPGLSNGSAWGDVDNDGDLDLVVSNRQDPSRLFVNAGGGHFEAVEIGDTGWGVGPSLVDFDNDGDLDLLVPKGVNYAERNELFRNLTDGTGNWLHVWCVGTASNRSAIGARVRVKATIDGEPRWQVREVQTRSGRATQSGLRLHFGLAEATVVDSIVVAWPSGGEQVLVGVASNQTLTITEGEDGDIATAGETGGGAPAFRLEAPYPNPFATRTSLRVTFEEAGPAFVAVYDVLGRRVRTLLREGVQPGSVELSWDARDEGGQRLAAGVYFVRATAAGKQGTTNVTLLR